MDFMIREMAVFRDSMALDFGPTSPNDLLVAKPPQVLRQRPSLSHRPLSATAGHMPASMDASARR